MRPCLGWVGISLLVTGGAGLGGVGGEIERRLDAVACHGEAGTRFRRLVVFLDRIFCETRFSQLASPPLVCAHDRPRWDLRWNHGRFRGVQRVLRDHNRVAVAARGRDDGKCAIPIVVEMLAAVGFLSCRQVSMSDERQRKNKGQRSPTYNEVVSHTLERFAHHSA